MAQHPDVNNSKKFNFLYSFRPVYYFSRAMGFMPFTIVCNSNGTIQGPAIRSFDIFWFILSICGYILLTIFSFLNIRFPENSKNTESTILIGADYFLLLLGFVFSVVVIIMDFCNRFKLVKILKHLNTFDEEASPAGSRFDFSHFLTIFSIPF